MKQLICLVLFLSAGATYAQDQRLLLTLSPLSVADFYDGFSIRPGAEVKMTKTVYLAVETGWYLHHPPWNLSSETDAQGYILKPSVVFRFAQEKRKNDFLVIEYQYKFKKYQILDSIQPPADRKSVV